jgi:hypothetical protein
VGTSLSTGEMSDTSSGRYEERRRSPPLDNRLERFARRYVDSPAKLDIMRTVGHYPDRSFALADLEYFCGSPVAGCREGGAGTRGLGPGTGKEAQRRPACEPFPLSRHVGVTRPPSPLFGQAGTSRTVGQNRRDALRRFAMSCNVSIRRANVMKQAMKGATS